MTQASDRSDHREFVTYDPKTRIATCSSCGLMRDFKPFIPVTTGGDRFADHSFGYGINITATADITNASDDANLKPFEDFLNNE